MKKPLQTIIASAMTLFIASPTIAQDNVVRATRYIYFWDVTGSLTMINDTSLRDMTFDFLFNDIENQVRDYEVIVHPFNDKILDTITFYPGDKFNRDILESYGCKYVADHDKAWNNNTQASSYKEMCNGGYTNVGSATKKAAEYFKSDRYNNIIILVTDGANEYCYDEKSTPRPLKGGEGRAELRKGIKAANDAAVANTNTVNRFYYVAFGDDDPYKPHSLNETKTIEELQKDYRDLKNHGKTKVIYPNDGRIAIKFYGISAECRSQTSQSGITYHMNSRDTSLEIDIAGNEELKEPITLEVTCSGDCLNEHPKTFTFEIGAKDRSIKLDGLDIIPNAENNSRIDEFDITIKIVAGTHYEQDNLYYEVYMKDGDNNGVITTTAYVTEEFSGTIKVRLL